MIDSENLIWRLELSRDVCMGDLWDSTSDDVLREAYHQIADDLDDARNVIKNNISKISKLKEVLSLCDDYFNMLPAQSEEAAKINSATRSIAKTAVAENLKKD